MALDRRRFFGIAGALSAGLTVAPHLRPLPARAAAGGTVGFDRYSLIINGERVYIWSGEFHPFRLPSPELWLDVLQKMRANGYTAVSMYFSWNYHTPAPGSYDFTGVRDIGAALDAAARAGLWVLARPGPYINGEVDAGGFPGWLTTIAGRARSDAPDYLAAVDEWLGHVNPIIAARQHTRGGGTVVGYQIENEYAANVGRPAGVNYLAHLYAKAREDGIDVPIFHNDKGRHGYWTPGAFPGSGSDYMYAFDGYPSANGTPPDWGYFGTGGPTGGASASPDTPGFIAEFGGGWFDPWGDATYGGEGYAAIRRLDGPEYEKQFYLTNVANGIRLHNVYMTFGGTPGGGCPRRWCTRRTTTARPSTRRGGRRTSCRR